MQFDVASFRRVAERWSAKEEDINPSAAAVLMLQMCSEIERLRLTEEEREAIESAIQWCEDITYGEPNDEEAAATLRALLKRTTL